MKMDVDKHEYKNLKIQLDLQKDCLFLRILQIIKKCENQYFKNYINNKKDKKGYS